MNQLASWHTFVLVYSTFEKWYIGYSLGPETVDEIPHLIKEVDRRK